MIGAWLVSAAALARPAPIVGGGPSAAGDWPDAAALLLGGEVHCTGVLVARDLVLTAAHCAEAVEEAVVGDPVVAGAARVPVVASFVHPDALSTLDLAALVLDGPVDVPPRALAVDCAAPAIADGAVAVVAGYGATEPEGAAAARLMEVEVPIVDADCGDLERGCNPAVSPGGELVAGGGGADTCSGDSGGPLYLEVEGAWLLAGTTSRAAWPSTAPCGDGGIYVRADAAIDWVELSTGRALSRAECGDWNHPPRPTVRVPATLHAGVEVALTVAANDPDAGDTHTFAVDEAPSQGEASIDGAGVLTYLPDWTAEGDDAMAVRVTDDGGLSATLAIDVVVAPAPWPPSDPPAPRGCQVAGGGWWGWALPWAVVRAPRDERP